MTQVMVPCRSCEEWRQIELPEGGSLKLKEHCECGAFDWDFQKVTSLRTFVKRKYKRRRK